MKAVVVGAGPHGRRIIKAIQSLSDVTLTAVVDRSAEALNSLDVDASVHRVSDLEAVLAEHAVGLACIATNGPSHAALANQCMHAGVRRVMVEKPLACSLEEAESIRATANETGSIVAVDHPRRYSRSYGYVRDGIATGRWGEVRSVYIMRPGIGLGCLATHSFDLASYLIGKPVLGVTAWVDEAKTENPRGAEFNDPGGTVILDYGNGVRGLVSQIEDGAGPMSVEVSLTAGRIRIDEKLDLFEVLERNMAVAKTPTQGAAYQRVEHPEGIGGKRVLVDEVAMLINDLALNDSPAAGIGCGYASIEALIAAYVSHEQGNRPIALPLDAVHHDKWLPVT